MPRFARFWLTRLFCAGASLPSVLAGCGDSGQPASDTAGGTNASGASSGNAGTGGIAGGSAGGPTSAAGGGAGGGSSNAGASTGGNSSAGAGGQVSSGSAGHVNGGSGGALGNGGATGGSGGNAGGGGGNGGNASASNGTIVPLYSYPNAVAWNAIVQAKQAHDSVEVVAIVNPSSGPGAGTDATFTTGIAKLVAAGIVPIGYVSTNYTKRGESAVNADTDSWRAQYPAVQGIFFDEQSAKPGDEAFYTAVSTHAKGKGFTLTVGNPGTGVPDSFVGSVDVMLSYESAGTPTLNSLKPYAAHRDHFGIIPYATAFDAEFAKSAVQSVRYVYLTNDDLPNPWDTLPSYFDALLGALAP